MTHEEEIMSLVFAHYGYLVVGAGESYSIGAILPPPRSWAVPVDTSQPFYVKQATTREDGEAQLRYALKLIAGTRAPAWTAGGDYPYYYRVGTD